MRSRLQIVGGLAGLVLAVVVGCARTADVPSQQESSAETASTVTQSPWNPVFSDLHGLVRPADDPATKAIALIFVLPDCPICNSYVPELNRIHEAFAQRGAAVLLIHADKEVTADKAFSHASEYKIACPVVLDAQQTWVKRAGATIAPEAAVFSVSGELLYRGRIDDQYAGLGKRRMVVTSHDLRDALEAVLAGKPVPQPRTEAIGCPIPK